MGCPPSSARLASWRVVLSTYRLIGDAEVLLQLPAAPRDATSSRVEVTVTADGQPLPGAEVLALFPNGSWKLAVADEHGQGVVDLYTTDLPMTVFCAAHGHAARLVRQWLPASGGLALELDRRPGGGSAIFPDATGALPGISGQLTTSRDEQDRGYLDAWNLTIDQGRPQPVRFVPGQELRLTDSDGWALFVRLVEMIGRSALVEYRKPGPGE